MEGPSAPHDPAAAPRRAGLEPVPAGRWIKVFVPASVANLGPGYDALGIAVEGIGDTIEARRLEGSGHGVTISGITGHAGKIPGDAAKNCAGVAAASVLKILEKRPVPTSGIEMRIEKGMPGGSGLGSSAASAVGGAVAAALLHGAEIDNETLLDAALDGEEIASGGRHADNLAPSLMGGLVIVKSLDPVEVVRVEAPRGLRFVLVLPEMEIETRHARSVLPKKIPLHDAVSNWAHVGAFVAATIRGDIEAMGRAVVDRVVEPARAGLIPGFAEIRASAIEAGAAGCSISGAGPTIFAIATEGSAERVGDAMQAAFRRHGLKSRRFICAPDNRGARRID